MILTEITTAHTHLTITKFSVYQIIGFEEFSLTFYFNVMFMKFQWVHL